MKKQWYVSCTHKGVLICAIVSGLVLLLTIILTVNNIMPPIANHSFRVTYLSIIMFLAFCSFIIFIATTEIYVIGLLSYYLDKKKYEQDLAIVEALPNEFVEVKLHDKSYLQKFISDDSIKCEAKFDSESNCIVYKITVDVETSTDDYAKFLENFKIVE